jgi:hypothetical protein
VTAHLYDLPADPCPGAGPFAGVAAFAVHVYPVTCSVCDRPGRVRWWINGAHLCAPCFRARAEADA